LKIRHKVKQQNLMAALLLMGLTLDLFDEKRKKKEAAVK
jgi:hypothetical protein